MRGLCPFLRSMPISVYPVNILNFNTMVPVSSKIITPCISFVHEKDTFDTLLARILSVALVDHDDISASDSDYAMLNLSMYAIKNSFGHPLIGGNHSADDSIWSVLEKLFRAYSYSPRDAYHACAEANSFVDHIPQIGIYQQAPEKEGTSTLRYVISFLMYWKIYTLIRNILFYFHEKGKEKANPQEFV